MEHITAKELSLFFFYLILDEKQALILASEAHDHYIKDKTRSDRESFVIKITQKFLKKIKPKNKNDVLILKSEFIKIKADLEIWSRFIKTNSLQDIAILVWHYQLGYSIEKISQTLHLTISTVQMRLSKSTNQLGDLTKYQTLKPAYESVQFNKDFKLSKYHNREVTEFHALGMVWDYLNNNLDTVSKKSFEDAEKKYPKIKEKIENIKKALEYLKHIRDIEIEDNILSEVEIPTSYFDLLVEKTKADTWPDSVKWIMEAFLVSVGVTMAAILVPWGKVNTTLFNTRNQLVTIVSMEHKHDENMGDPKLLNSTETQVYAEDEGTQKNIPQPQATEKPATGTIKPPSAQAVEVKPEKPAEVKVTPSVPPTKIPEKAQAPVAQSPTEVKAAIPASTPTEEVNAESKKIGFLFRGSVTTANIPVASVKIKEKIESLGGRKAANAELGWRNSPTTSYFHFTIPESKYEELVEFLKTYGEVKILKEKHSKVMPEGIIRLIIQAEEPKVP